MAGRTSWWRGSFLVAALLVVGCDSSPLTGAGGAAGSAAGAAGGIAGAGGDAPAGLGGAAGGSPGITGEAGGDGNMGAGASSGCVPTPPPADPTMAGCAAVDSASLGEASHPNEGQTHLTLCSTTCYQTNPPSSGNHYPVWPVYKTYDAPVPWGFLVHGLEHGAVIVSYNCPCGCPDEVAAAQAWIDALPMDTDCLTPPRVVMAPDPHLDVRWAASAWTWTLREQSFDPAVFQAFFDAHYNKAPEEICSGYTDGSTTGWCQ